MKTVNITPDTIRLIREKLGMTSLAFAKYLGVGYVTVSRWENGHFHPSRHTRRLLERAARRAKVEIA